MTIEESHLHKADRHPPPHTGVCGLYLLPFSHLCIIREVKILHSVKLCQTPEWFPVLNGLSASQCQQVTLEPLILQRAWSHLLLTLPNNSTRCHWIQWQRAWFLWGSADGLLIRIPLLPCINRCIRKKTKRGKVLEKWEWSWKWRKLA